MEISDIYILPDLKSCIVHYALDSQLVADVVFVNG